MLNVINSTIELLSDHLVKPHVSDYLMIECPYKGYVFDFENGEQVSVIRLDGLKKISGPEEYKKAEEALSQLIESSLVEGYQLAVFYERDPFQTKREAERSVADMALTAEALGADIDDILENRKRVIEETTVFETSYLLVATKLMSLPNARNAVSEQVQKNMKALTEYQPKLVNGTNNFVHYSALDSNHNQIMEFVEGTLDSLGFAFKKLTNEEMGSLVGEQLERGSRTLDYRARTKLTGEQTYKRFRNVDNPNDHSEAVRPYIKQALTTEVHSNVDLNGNSLPDGVRRVGNVYYASVSIDFWPDVLSNFNALFNAIPRSTPFRYATYIDCEDHKLTSLHQMTRSFVGQWGNPKNALAKTQTEEMMEVKRLRNKGYYRLQGQISTWGASAKEAIEHTNAIKMALSKWGNTEGSLYTPNPTAMFVSSVVGATLNCSAPTHQAPASDIPRLLPIERPASIWETGTVQFGTKDGKLWPYKVTSSEVENNFICLFGKPRRGKSNMLNTFNFSLVFQKGNVRLPRILTIDNGPSSLGRCTLLQERLPPKLSDQVLYTELQPDKRDLKLNLFDTMFGTTKPLPFRKDMIKLFLSELVTSLSTGEVPENTHELLGEAIDLLYSRFAKTDLLTGQGARLYVPSHSEEIHKKLKEILPANRLDEIQNIGGKTKITWFEVRDVLYSSNEVTLAKEAHLQAMPIIDDLIQIIGNNQQIKSAYGASLCETLQMRLQNAVKDYQIIDSRSTVSFADKKILALDLRKLTSGVEGPESERKASLMYMLAIAIGTELWFLDDASIDYYGQLYKSYAKELISEVSEDIKRIDIDEYWKTGNRPILNKFVEMLVRTGPKYNISTLLATHRVGDVGGLISMAAGIVLLGAPEASELSQLKESRTIPPTVEKLLKMNGFGQKKGECCFIIETDTDTYYQHLQLRSSSCELWANSSTNRDTTLRKKICQHFGNKRGLEILYTEFPGGNCEKEFQKVVDKMGTDDDDEGLSAVNIIANRLIENYDN